MTRSIALTVFPHKLAFSHLDAEKIYGTKSVLDKAPIHKGKSKKDGGKT